jgi:hypothetical protein
MNKLCRLAIALAASVTCAMPAAAAQLKPGYYSQLYYVVSTSVSGAGQCIDTVGGYFTQELYYPGPSKPGATEWRAFSANGLLENEIITLPVTPAAGVTTWSGTESSTFLPGSTEVTATFTVSGTFTDDHSSNGTSTTIYPTQGGGTCTETTQINQIYTGK